MSEVTTIKFDGLQVVLLDGTDKVTHQREIFLMKF